MLFDRTKQTQEIPLKITEELELIDRHMREVNEFREFYENVDTTAPGYNPEEVKRQFLKTLRRHVREVQKVNLW